MAKIIYGGQQYFLQEDQVEDLRDAVFRTLSNDEIAQVAVGHPGAADPILLYISRGVDIAIIPGG